MIKQILIIIFLCLNFVGFSQPGEGVEMITHNPQLIQKTKTLVLKSSPNTFDSTFIYTDDTLNLPFFDDFSTNKVQHYNANFTDAGVTSTLYYKLLDQSSIAIHPDSIYTTQQTFRRTYDINTDQLTTDYFTGETMQLGDLSTYPVDYQTITAYPPFYIFDTLGVADESDTIWIIGPDLVQDSARIFFAHVSNANKLWIDSNAYHNYRFAKNPWSLGVMTFDGIDATGYPYQIGTSLDGMADVLTSKRIDLSASSPADSIYLTFLYQKQGLGDEPELNDSLVLEFYDVAAQTWRWQWGGQGATSDEFILAHISVKDPLFFNNAFQFRFVNYGGLSGALDHFHVDYVNLRDFSGYQDTLIEDFAISYPTVTLLKDYSSVPWDHYQANFTGKMSTDVELTIRNSYLNGGANISSTGGGQIDIKYAGTLESSVNLNGQVMANYNPPAQPIPDYQPRTTYTSLHDVSAIQFDPTKIGSKQNFEIVTSVSVPVGSNFLPNDTAYSSQVFQNYYAYDDGSAELAYGPQGAQSMLAIKYTPYEADSVIGAYIHFVPTVNDVTNALFQLTIWDDNGGVPGTILYSDDAFYLNQPNYGFGMNDFVSYFTNDTVKVPVSGAFYIGWKQIDPVRLGVGFDQNTDSHQNNYFSLDEGATWTQSAIPGSVMIRPIFSTSMDAELGVQKIERPEEPVIIYPNPSTGWFHIRPNNQQELGEIKVYSMMGELVLSTNDLQFDLSNSPKGVYFVRLTSNPTKTYKIVKQ